MKLNYKRTILVGFAFFLICAFWQAYDNTIPLILTNKFGMSQTWSGIIMAADNVLALFMLPLFGAISDKCSHKKGRRTPFIVMGTLIAAVINLMGSAGGILVLALGMAFATASVHNALMSYTAYFAVIAAIMLAALVIFILTVREVEWAQQMQCDSVEYGVEDTAEDGASPQEERKLTRGEVKSLIFILLSIVLWFFGYNAVTSKYSVYASNILHKDYNLTLIIAQAAAIVAYLPVGVISSRVGRKRAIQAGVILLTVAFGVAGFLHAESPTLLMNAMFALAGIAWATINVNSFPMVVELSSGGSVGKYTGFYYTASMAAQVATPMLSGLLMDKWGMRVLFPYATVFVALAFATMLMVHHGDSKPQMKLGLEALQDSEMD